jgi:hypothetical protein
MINEQKSAAYYWHPRRKDRPGWTDQFNWQWATADDITKLLGSPFGLTLSTRDVDQFLIEKVETKLQYWSLVRLNAAGREVITNIVLISALLYFLAVWGGTKGGIECITSKIRTFFWSGSTTRTRTRVAWKVYCLRRMAG